MCVCTRVCCLSIGDDASLSNRLPLYSPFTPEDSNSDSSSINVVLLGALAKEFDRAVSQGVRITLRARLSTSLPACHLPVCLLLQDLVVASGFTVGSSPTHHKDHLHRCNLQLSGERACVFVSEGMHTRTHTHTGLLLSAPFAGSHF